MKFTCPEHGEVKPDRIGYSWPATAWCPQCGRQLVDESKGDMPPPEDVVALSALRASLEETRRALAFVTMIHRTLSPDDESSRDIDAMLERGARALRAAEPGRGPLLDGEAMIPTDLISEYIDSLLWLDETTERERNMITGHLRVFGMWLRQRMRGLDAPLLAADNGRA